MAALRGTKGKSYTSGRAQLPPAPSRSSPAPKRAADPGAAAGPCAAHEQIEQIAICPPPPHEMKGGTGMTNPQLSTLLLVFRHEPWLQPAQTAHGWLSHQPAPATQRRVSPPRWQRREQALPGTEVPRSQPPAPLQAPPAAHSLFEDQRQSLAESWGEPQGCSSQNKTNLFTSLLGHS